MKQNPAAGEIVQAIHQTVEQAEHELNIFDFQQLTPLSTAGTMFYTVLYGAHYANSEML